MDNKDTVITVGVTREDEYGNLWVTPQGGDKEIKIASKRSNLHPLFEQGKAIMLHWETYRNIPYVSDAKLVEGELPEPREPIEPKEDKPTPPQPPRMEASNLKNRAFALSYAKDLVVADKIKGNQLIFEAELLNQYLNGNITVPEEVLIKYVQEQVKAEMKEG